MVADACVFNNIYKIILINNQIFIILYPSKYKSVFLGLQ